MKVWRILLCKWGGESLIKIRRKHFYIMNFSLIRYVKIFIVIWSVNLNVRINKHGFRLLSVVTIFSMCFGFLGRLPSVFVIVYSFSKVVSITNSASAWHVTSWFFFLYFWAFPAVLAFQIVGHSFTSFQSSLIDIKWSVNLNHFLVSVHSLIFSYLPDKLSEHSLWASH